CVASAPLEPDSYTLESVRSAGATCAVLLAAAGLFAQDQPAKPAVVRGIEVLGATAYDLRAIQRVLRVKPGDTLRRPAAELAEVLERRYHIIGYPAARVEGRFDPATGTLTLAVDEGRLAAVELEGIEGSARERVLKVLDIRTGKPIRERDVSGALSRLERLSGGAYVSTAASPYTIEP